MSAPRHLVDGRRLGTKRHFVDVRARAARRKRAKNEFRFRRTRSLVKKKTTSPGLRNDRFLRWPLSVSLTLYFIVSAGTADCANQHANDSPLERTSDPKGRTDRPG